jgi:hypothetical protein
MSFDFNDGGDASNQGALLCRLLHVPKAFTGQVMMAAASAHGLITLDNCRQLLCFAFQNFWSVRLCCSTFTSNRD